VTDYFFKQNLMPLNIPFRVLGTQSLRHNCWAVAP